MSYPCPGLVVDLWICGSTAGSPKRNVVFVEWCDVQCNGRVQTHRFFNPNQVWPLNSSELPDYTGWSYWTPESVGPISSWYLRDYGPYEGWTAQWARSLSGCNPQVQFGWSGENRNLIFGQYYTTEIIETSEYCIVCVQYSTCTAVLSVVRRNKIQNLAAAAVCLIISQRHILDY